MGGGDAPKFLKQKLSIDFPIAPTFQLQDIGNSGHKEITMEFYLINKNNDWLERNFRFLQAFYAGTQWLQMDFGIIKGSNVYNVLCPGRFNILWASVGSKVTFVGKLRQNYYMFKRYGKTIKSITEDMLWPDAWKIEIHIKDLTPNNFNIYMNYYVNGAGTTFETIQGITSGYNNSLTNQIGTKIYSDDIIKAKSERLEEISRKQASLNKNNFFGLTGDDITRSETIRRLALAAGVSEEKLKEAWASANKEEKK